VLLVLIVGVLSYKSISQLESDSLMVDHTQKVIKTSTNLMQGLVDAETGMRGYVATHNKVFLEPYTAAIPAINSDIEQLKSLTRDNPVQVRRVNSLSSDVNEQLNILKTDIDTSDSKGLDYIVQNHIFLNGKRNMDDIRLLVERITDTENNLLAIRKANTNAASTQALVTIVVGSFIFLVIIVLLFFYIQGTFDRQKKIESEIKVANVELEKVLTENKEKNWLLTGTDLLNEKMQGQQSEKELSENILKEICSYTNALTGTLYLYNDDSENLILYASYAVQNPGVLKKSIVFAEGWVGQVAKNEKPAIVRGKLNNKLDLGSSLIDQNLVECFIVPFFFEKKLKGVIEVAFNNEPDRNNSDYILTITDDIGIAVNTAQARTIMQNLLSQVQQQAEELEAQQEEMRITNEELQTKTEMLQASEEEMKVQQEELRSANTELQEKAGLLEDKNNTIEEARKAIDLKVKELEITGKYKSEFLANMSHELRTPLNSILVLAKILADNKSANLTEDQSKYANVIFNAGNDLLTLINDILDLAKIESGKMEMQSEAVRVAGVVVNMEMLFAGVARSKKIRYTTAISKDLPESIFTDKVKLEQILKNLLSNAFKFTPENGAVEINVKPGNDTQTISFCIKDTGIGIAHDKQKVIFEAFQQADGSTSRKYGGTGLGLSISRDLAALLSGKITLVSQPGKGSEFILTIPIEANLELPEIEILPAVETFIPDKVLLKPAKQNIREGRAEPLVLIFEDDKNFAGILEDYSHQHGYRSIIINEGANAFEIVKENRPDAVILDIMLPGKNGWQVLKELKQDKETMHIPVHIMSAGDVAANRVSKEGAISFVKKPAAIATLNKLFSDIMVQSGIKFKQILLIEDNRDQSHALNELMQNQGITVDRAYDGESAFRMLLENEYQCVILDLNLPDTSGLDFLDRIKEADRFKQLPVIINTAMELDKTSVNRLMKYANAMVLKTNKSADRLIDEVNLFLNKIREVTPKPTSAPEGLKRGIVSKGRDALRGKKILVVDDDERNVFALSSALENYGMLVETAGDGLEAIDKLERDSNIDLVLMDIMMPKMDGYDATKYIRKQKKWAKLPVIALTAKAMMDDREKCIAAGANDYITKPVNMERLISLMQLWLTS
jgi:CheY-like chemotaxis protein/signal transduction histidine kinase/CHASE3 domain sensor protein